MLKDLKPIILLQTVQKDKAKIFYQETLGLTFKADDGFALVFDAGENMLRVASVKEFTPHHFAVLGWETPDIIAVIESLATKGVKFERYNFPWMEQDKLGVWTSPDGTKIAWFKDPDGNLLSLTQMAK